MSVYYKFSDFLRNQYQHKVYKLPVNLPVTCPNRDGTIGVGGCLFCGEEGAGFENLPSHMTVTEQLIKNMENLKKRYKPERYIAYFQNYTNTYLPMEVFSRVMEEACLEKVVALYISTRPDCISMEQIKFLTQLKRAKQVDIVIEMGLQSVREETLVWLHRGHTVKDFEAANAKIKENGLQTCAHYILDIPMDTLYDVKNGAMFLSRLDVDQVKCHSLYILKRTKLGDLYEEGKFEPLQLEDFLERATVFLENLKSEIVVQRLLGRAPAERTLFCNYGQSAWKIQDMLIGKMKRDGQYQGRLFIQ